MRACLLLFALLPAPCLVEWILRLLATSLSLDVLDEEDNEEEKETDEDELPDERDRDERRLLLDDEYDDEETDSLIDE